MPKKRVVLEIDEADNLINPASGLHMLANVSNTYGPFDNADEKTEPMSVSKLVQLKAEGFTAADIVELREGGVL